nr:hypothetical protein [Tanacetum cinerariifolium]
QKNDSRDSFNELMDTPLDFSAFVMNRLKVDTLTPELLVGPTFELMKGSCKSLMELEYFLEEVYKETTNQIDWNNPEGQKYPHVLRKPLRLIPNSQGRRVIPFDHFINNDLAYLKGGASSRTYATSVTKTNAADYGHIKWIEDLLSSTMWSLVHIIIVVTKLQIVEWHNYKHLDWIIVHRNDDKLYTFKEGDYKRIRLQDIEDMRLLLTQGKLTNLTIKERIALNVSLQMLTRSIVIQRRVEDLQLCVESYQKKLNLTRPDAYRSNLKRLPRYSAYSNPRGFIYHNKEKKNILIRIDELHKFSDGTLNDVRTALDDILKRIRMKKPLTPDRDWNKTLPAVQGSAQTCISELAKQADSHSSFNELEYHLEEVYKATTDQLDWVNPEGQQYPHNLLQPLPLIPDNQGDFKRLRLQDIQDMLLLLVQGKLSNLTVKERFAFNVSLRMFTRSIVIERRMEDLQFGVESYQKRLNLTKPDTYRSDLKRREAYTAYPNPRGFIYQNKDKKNRLMRIDELHKFSEGTLNDVCDALDDRLKGIRMQYLPQTIWRKGDKDRAAAMIQAIDRMLKTRRIMRSLKWFVGGRLYEGDFRMLQRTI